MTNYKTDATVKEQLSALDSSDIREFLDFVDKNKPMSSKLTKRILSMGAIKKVQDNYSVDKVALDPFSIADLRDILFNREQAEVNLRIKRDRGVFK